MKFSSRVFSQQSTGYVERRLVIRPVFNTIWGASNPSSSLEQRLPERTRVRGEQCTEWIAAGQSSESNVMTSDNAAPPNLSLEGDESLGAADQELSRRCGKGRGKDDERHRDKSHDE
jgi:hypothetical protein